MRKRTDTPEQVKLDVLNACDTMHRLAGRLGFLGFAAKAAADPELDDMGPEEWQALSQLLAEAADEVRAAERALETAFRVLRGDEIPEGGAQ